MKCFITGGSGFIGSNLITKFIDEDIEVLAMARSAESANTIKDLGAFPAFAGTGSVPHPPQHCKIP